MRIDCSGEYTLHASCKRVDGSWQASSISLNRFLSNDHGSFRWVGGDKRQEVAAPRQVTVQAGDTLRGIARQVGCGFEEIAKVNGIQNPDLIYPGQVLNVPGGAPACGGGNGGAVGNFGLSARNVRLMDRGRRLEAELLRDGQWVGSSIVLDERIGNDNGTLTFKS
jgi:LysM repeat protein